MGRDAGIPFFFFSANLAGRPCGCQDEVRSYPSGPFGRINHAPPNIVKIS